MEELKLIDINAIRELCHKATPGPWKIGTNSLIVDANGKALFFEPGGKYNAEFIAKSREIIPALLDELERANGAIQEWKDGICISQKYLTMIGKLQAENEQLQETKKALENDIYNAEMNLSRLLDELKAAQNAHRWIPVEEALPTESDADEDGAVLAIHKSAKKKHYHWKSVDDNPFDFKCWMPMPDPPEGEE